MSDFATKLIQYFEKSDPDEWHKIALGWNWDNDIEPLRWIAEQPTCDRATALLIYWQGGAGFYARYKDANDVPEWDLPVYKLLKFIEARYTSDGYTRHEIAFDPADDLGSNWTSDYLSSTEILTPIPDKLLQAVPGRKVTEVYPFEGLPPEFADE